MITVNSVYPQPLQGARWPLALAIAVLVFCTTLFYIRNVPLGHPPDEWAHLGYVADVASGHRVIPNYANSVILNSTQKNYLAHPPLYYSLQGGLGRVFSWDVRTDYEKYRAVSAIVVSAGVFLWCLVALQLGFSRVQAAGLTIATLALPMFPYLAGSVNNDNLCYFGVALFFYGFLLLQSSVWRGSYISAAGIVVVLLTKATGGVFLLAFLAAWSLLDWRRTLLLIRERHFIIAALAASIIVAAYFIPTTVIYHTPFPAPGTLYQQFPPPQTPMHFLEYAKSFSREMIERLPIVSSHHSFFPIPETLNSLFYLMLCLPLAAWISFRPFSTHLYKRHLADAFLIALAATILANLWVSWQGYLQTGLHAGIQPRYYNYAIPGLFVFAFSEGIELRRKRYLLFAFACLAILFAAIIPPRAAMSLLRGMESARFERLTAPDSPLTPTSTLRKEAGAMPAAGYVDGVQFKGNEMIVTGWAIDIRSKQPARALWLSVAGHLLGTARPAQKREDVAQSLGSPEALRSGFRITVSNVPAGLSACDIVAEAEQDTGSLATLANPGCHPPSGAE